MTIEDQINELFSRIQKFTSELPDTITEEELIKVLQEYSNNEAKELLSDQCSTVIITPIYGDLAAKFIEKKEDRELFKELPTLRRFPKDLL